MGEINSECLATNSDFGCEIIKIQKYAVERVSINVENQKIYALLKSNCNIPIINKKWASRLRSCLLVKEYGLEWGIINISQNQTRRLITGLLGDIFSTTGFNLILPWAININENFGGDL